jgi:CubicO group peptidase (beta-lactamase class C family)
MNTLFKRIAPAILILAISASQLLAASKVESINGLMTKYSQLRQFNGSVLVADQSGVIYKKGFGYANFEWEIPNTPDTRFRLGSITKQFTSMVIMQLVAEGKIKLDDPVTTYLPDYRKDTGDRVTITQLLNHTSGIPSYTGVPGFFQNDSRDAYTVADFVKRFASGDLEFEPGTKWAYNNSGYFLLGAIIERVTGKTYAEALQERIFTPLGMKASGYDLASPVIPKRASGYALLGGKYVNAPYLDMSIPYAAGSLYSTVEDLYLWDRALYSEKLIKKELAKQMFTPGLSDYGYGWIIKKTTLQDGRTEVATISHDGGIHGFNTKLVRVPEKQELVVLLDNTSRGDKLDEISAGILSILHGVAPKQPRKSIIDELQSVAKDGAGAAIVAKYRDLRKKSSDEFDFKNEGELNMLGYALLAQSRIDDAIEVFKLNVEMFPDSSNPYDSLGEAYAIKGEKELAIRNYRRSYELNNKNQNALEAIARLEKPSAAVEQKYPLEAFVGKYELAPAFVLSVFIEDGKLMTQATGQGKIGLRADAATEFSVIGVPARLVFEMDDTTKKAKSVTLHQGGRVMPAKKIE